MSAKLSEKLSKEPAKGLSELSDNAKQLIDKEVAKYPAGKQASAVMSALRIAQEENGGWLSTELVESVAAYLQMPSIQAYEVATFYNMYELKPVGKNKLCLCTNLPCLLMGAQKTATALKKELGIGFGETSADNRWTLKEGECFGACNSGPAIIVNNKKMHEHITADKVPDFIASFSDE